MRRSTIVFLLPLLMTVPLYALGLQLTAGPAVKSAVVVDTASVAAGKTFTVGVRLTTGNDFHIYWTNPGEGGLPTRFQWRLPPGFRAEALPFPLPHTFVQPGNITGYGYSGEAVFLFRITAPATLAAGPHNFSVTADWLSCDKEKCTPGSAKLDFSLPAGDGVSLKKLDAEMAALPLPLTPAVAVAQKQSMAVTKDDAVLKLPASHTKADYDKVIAAWKLTYPVLNDAKGVVGRQYDAKTTPHMYIISAEGKLLYNGAIDDDPDGTKATKVNYVEKALAELAAGKTVTVSESKPYGCAVKY